MRIILALVMVMCLWTMLAYAGVDAEIIAKDTDSNGNIIVWSCYKINGKEVSSQYPKIDGHYVYATRYSKQNFLACKDKAEIENYILNDIGNHTDTIIQQEFDRTAPKTFSEIQKDYNRTANQAFADANLDKLIGKSVSATEVIRQIDSNNDGVMDKEITLKPDGTKIEANIITP